MKRTRKPYGQVCRLGSIGHGSFANYRARRNRTTHQKVGRTERSELRRMIMRSLYRYK